MISKTSNVNTFLGQMWKQVFHLSLFYSSACGMINLKATLSVWGIMGFQWKAHWGLGKMADFSGDILKCRFLNEHLFWFKFFTEVCSQGSNW